MINPTAKELAQAVLEGKTGAEVVEAFASSYMRNAPRQRPQTPAGTYKNGTPGDIARMVMRAKRGDKDAARRSLQFYLNRGGRGVDGATRHRVGKAKEMCK